MDTEENDTVDYEKLYENLESENINLRLHILKIKNSSQTFIEKVKEIIIAMGIDRVIYISGLIFSLFIIPAITLHIDSKRKD